MNVDGKHYRTIWPAADEGGFEVIDQTRLPHEFAVLRIRSARQAADAIRDMVVRGAPLIGATAAYGMALAMREDSSDAGLETACAMLLATRPTAVNLRWAIHRVADLAAPLPPAQRATAVWAEAARICDADVEANRAIGEHGMKLLRQVHDAKTDGEPVNVLTHCNAGWLATVDWGTALAPVYLAHDSGIPVHVWVDETRPRNQGAGLTAWELGHHGVPHTMIVDNVGGHLMQRGMVDCCITGSDRTTAAGDVCNKIGTYLKALAARESGIPFYVALPGSTVDWSIEDGQQIPIEQRDGAEVSQVAGRDSTGTLCSVTVTPDGTPVANYAFDVTPAHLVTALVTERGVCAPSRDGLADLFPDRAGLPT